MIASLGTIEALLLLGGVLMYLLCQAVHDTAIARAALACGDTTARDQGRISLNPWVHVDPLRTLLLPVVLGLTTTLVFGCGRHLPVNAQNLRRPRRDVILVSLAGSCANLALAILLAAGALVLTRLGLLNAASLGYSFLMQAIGINLLLCLVHLIPLPPLDASRVLSYYLPSEHRAGYEGIGIYGLLFLVAAFFSPLGEFFWQQANANKTFDLFRLVAQLIFP